MLHKFPHEVDEMPFEDALELLAYCEVEAEQAERSSGAGKRQTQTIKLRKR